eukprot:TRINITY_DN2897_c0_g1_i2.p1 TRINITY_DN2897_c0_g1~~TRINITY_DN2897_c0_g1_i2.p1  ORF type:complete len:141 (+),score=9.17 TRINITY_DN2897_c0_g1_i2:42-425(+)
MGPSDEYKDYFDANETITEPKGRLTYMYEGPYKECVAVLKPGFKTFTATFTPTGISKKKLWKTGITVKVYDGPATGKEIASFAGGAPLAPFSAESKTGELTVVVNGPPGEFPSYNNHVLVFEIQPSL